jgi:macrolide-specific efflux system membrane fusion protein
VDGQRIPVLRMARRRAGLSARMTTSGAVLPPIGPDDTAEVPAIEAAPPPPRRFGRKRTVISVVVVIVAAGAGVGIWLGTKGSAPSPLTMTTQVVSVTTGTMKKTVSASGTIEPAQQASLNFGAAGQVTAVDVTTGQSVTAGQTLATIDPSALQAELASAQASLTAAQAQLASDQASAASASQIYSDQAQVASAQSGLTSAQTNRADAALTSTITGTVASVNLTVGQQVSGGGSASGSSSAQIVVVGTSGYVVTTTVDDTQVGQVKVGNQVDIVPSGSGTPVYGTVTSVGLIASGSSGVATFPVGIAVTGNPSGLYAGTSATVSIIVQQIDNAVEVPTAAIAYSPNGQATVVVVQNGNQVPRAITTGVSSGGDTQVTSGLSPGDKVLEHVVTFNRTAGGGNNLFGGSTNGPGGGGGPQSGQIIIRKGGGPGG